MLVKLFVAEFVEVDRGFVGNGEEEGISACLDSVQLW